MAVLLKDIKLPVGAERFELPACVAQQFKLPKEAVQTVRIVRQSLDARRKNDIHFLIHAVVQVEDVWQAKLLKSGDRRVEAHEQPEAYELVQGTKTPEGRIVVAGFGPAGMFAAYYLAKHGYKPLVIERGANVEKRTEAVEHFWSGGSLDENNNVMFGEGGAGTFSDGKLTSRSKNPRSSVVLDTFVDNGAPEEIAFKAKPHIGTDKLKLVVKNMREKILRAGGEIRFETKLSDIECKDGRLTHAVMETNGTKERVECAALILAVGQAARDTYRLLLSHGVALQPKPFAVGLRIEHPQGLIDRAQFGELAGHPRLGAAEYRLSAKSGGRGVYTFCMCPGGSVVASSSGQNEVVVNGMSVHARNGENANSAVVVQVGPDDFGHEPLSGVRFQETLEKQAFQAGSGAYMAPAQRLEDFMSGKKSKAFMSVQPTYRPGVEMAVLNDILPGFVAQGIQESIPAFARQLKGFDYKDAVLTAVESRTSSPVRIIRGEDMQTPAIKGLFPVGEGAGYAGGIVSAAIDGLMACEKIAAVYKPLS
ncbi:hypothetical protein LJC27_05945 [Christensenellaceae bacterium OttesenSCG-928-M15]|nr:hypothetical protein [Christensenellaceae bacterium OttesenSCG-928-M15]